MDKEVALVVGTLTSVATVGCIGSLATRSATQGFIFGVAYLGFCGFVWIVLGVRRVSPRLTELSPRETLWLPFAPVFLTPLWLAVAALVHEWKVDQPAIRYVGIAAGFALAVPAMLFHRWLSGVSVIKEGPNQPPQRNAGNRPSSGDSPASETPSSLGPRG